MTHPTAYSDQLQAQARDIAGRLVQVAQKGTVDTLDLARGPVAEEIANGASCCVDDQLGLAVMVIADLVRRAAPTPAAVAAERERIRKLLTRPLLAAIRCIPDGEIRNLAIDPERAA